MDERPDLRLQEEELPLPLAVTRIRDLYPRGRNRLYDALQLALEEPVVHGRPDAQADPHRLGLYEARTRRGLYIEVAAPGGPLRRGALRARPAGFILPMPYDWP